MIALLTLQSRRHSTRMLATKAIKKANAYDISEVTIANALGIIEQKPKL